MRQISDFHIHSRYSRACSRNLTLENIDRTCRVKGIDIIGTGDFTHPAWFASINGELEELPHSKGLYKLKRAADECIKFTLTSEVALIYKKNDRCRRVHLVIHGPDITAVKELNEYLDTNYNIRSDGRPILGMSIEKLCEICFAIHPHFLIYPAHIWTPWFSIFGSKSGFDSWEAAFGEYADRIFAYETGLSSDPEMNWRVSALDKFTLLSNSDAHSLPNLAREANIFELERVDYDTIYNAISRHPMPASAGIGCLSATIEFYPEEGMYHFDGHRDCGFSSSGAETKRLKGICPKCKKPLIIGVDYRVNELADREAGLKPEGAPGFKKLVELDKIIAEVLHVKNRSSKKVQAEYTRLIGELGPELMILLDTPLEKIREAGGERLAEGVRRVRSGELSVKPGFDGLYGKVSIFGGEEKKVGQKNLF